jgi:hypothetical protein
MSKKTKEETISVEMRPDIIAKASPNLEKIDAKAVAGMALGDIIERNVIAEFEEDEGEEPEQTGE